MVDSVLDFAFVRIGGSTDSWIRDADAPEAEDTMQDVLFRSLLHLGRFPDPNALAAWLYTVTRNRWRRVRRTHSRFRVTAISLEE